MPTSSVRGSLHEQLRTILQMPERENVKYREIGKRANIRME